MSRTRSAPAFPPTDTFIHRHLGPDAAEVADMLKAIGLGSLDELVERAIPASIRVAGPLDLPPGRGEREFLTELRAQASRNVVARSYIGMGYSGTIVPPVLLRNVLENPGWYTQYTPYQAEISQGRLEALLVFQTMISDLTGLPLANASLLDEGTAAAEALCMCHRSQRSTRDTFFVSERCHPQTISVVMTRADALGLQTIVGDPDTFDFESAAARAICGYLVSYPTSEGNVWDPTAFAEKAHAAGGLVVCASDLLALTLLTPPGELGVDVCVGSAQRFGVPMGYGGPHAAFLATSEKFKRHIPGRIIGVSKDARGEPALRMAMQTREQHIRREKATSNICTAQVLLAILSGLYAVYHGPDGLRTIARRVHDMTRALAAALERMGYRVEHAAFFDTLCVSKDGVAAQSMHAAAGERGVNLRILAGRDDACGVSLDETVTDADLEELFAIFATAAQVAAPALADVVDTDGAQSAWPEKLTRKSAYLEHPVFHENRSEHQMLRFLKRLESRDLSLTTSMIPLGSCTMKLNGTTEMIPVTWPEFGDLHPFAPLEQAQGYAQLFRELKQALCEITGFADVSLQPNAGSQGEYAGLLCIRRWHEARGEGHRNVCLIPVSAHGTNPASAILAGMRVVTVACDERGNVDLEDLTAKAVAHAGDLAALMITYPSTHGVFEARIREICDAVHANGGQVYLDGANMNAQVGLCRPGDYGADVCHLNLHKTFCIPHGGGGPGMGPIAVASHLAAHLPDHPLVRCGGDDPIGTVSAAPWGSPSILTISWAYVALMGGEGLTQASRIAILNANYMARRLSEHFAVLYMGEDGMVAHEFILDFRPFEKSAGVSVEDVAKRLMDYGFHAPTMSFPVVGTLMIEPTESETKAELDRLCDALISIRGEIRDIEEGRLDREDNPLRRAPHTSEEVCADNWERAYSRERAAFPAPWVRAAKFWPAVGRIDNGFGDRNLICSCPPMEDYEEPPAPTSRSPRAREKSPAS